MVFSNNDHQWYGGITSGDGGQICTYMYIIKNTSTTFKNLLALQDVTWVSCM